MPWFSTTHKIALIVATSLIATMGGTPIASALPSSQTISTRFIEPDNITNSDSVHTTPHSTTTTSNGQIRSFWLHLNGTVVNEKMLETEAKRRSYIVLNAWESNLIPQFKASNPAVKIFVYKDLSSTRSYACRNGTDDVQLPTGVGYCYANKQRPDWFLRDSNGQRLEYSGYPDHWQMDVGNPDYQNAWADNVIASTKAAGFDGVFMDNALFPCDAYHKGICPAKYKSAAAIQNAYKSMLANTRSKFTSAGLKTVANLSNARLYQGAWDAYMQYLDGGFDEWWLAFGSDDLLSEYPEGWNRQVAEIASNETKGKMTWVQPHFNQGDERAFLYTLASYLMANGSHAAITEIERTDGYGSPTPRRAEHNWELGTPTGPYRSVGNNVFRRDFTCGVALVNANKTDSGPITIKLDNAYTNSNNAKTTSVTLEGTSGAILRKSC